MQELRSQSTATKSNNENRSSYNLSNMSGGSANDFALKNNLYAGTDLHETCK